MVMFKGWRIGSNPVIASKNTVVFSIDEGKSWANLPLYLERVNHSPTGFNWGYHGSGPAQLAFAILMQYLISGFDVDPDIAHNSIDNGIYQTFKQDFVAKWDNKWELQGQEIEDWFGKLEV